MRHSGQHDRYDAGQHLDCDVTGSHGQHVYDHGRQPMIADDFNDIAVRLKQIEQKTIESQWCERFRDEAELSKIVVPRRWKLPWDASNVEFVQ